MLSSYEIGKDVRGRLILFICALTFLSVCFFPYIPITDQLSIRLEDLLFPIVLFLVLPSWKELLNLYFILILAWGIWGLLSMAVNGRLFVLNDYFELYKLFKYMGFVLLFLILFRSKLNVFKFVSIIFLLLVCFNLFHYFNIMQFNTKVMPIFCPNKMQLLYFGRNSLGGVATKRILGTMGNPNVNAILFSFFTVYFITFLKETGRHFGKLFFFLSFIMILYTQSRTCMAATGIIILMYIILTKPDKREWITLVVGCSISILLVWISDFYSLDYFTNASWNVSENGSLRGRLEVWGQLLEMIYQSPIFGYGINKNYFYENQLYSENEYILMLWRYGIPGLILYSVLLFGLIWKFRSPILKHFEGRNLTYLFGVVMIGFNAITNNPLSNPMILIIFAALTGYFLSQFGLLNEIFPLIKQPSKK